MMPTSFFAAHRETLTSAMNAIATRGFWSAYPEIPSGKIYGESAKADGSAAFAAMRGSAFEMDLPGVTGTTGSERSPYGGLLEMTYPAVDPVALIDGMNAACPSWASASIEDRVGVCLEILHRLNAHSFLMANAVMQTTGQGFMMAFQAGGPHAQDRGLEAVAWAYREMTACPQSATWRKQVGRDEFITLEKTWRVIPRGIGVVVGCSTFPTWNTYPGLFASLATGNAVIVKPHPGAILPVAITVRMCREVLEEAGFDPNVVTMAADTAEAPITKELLSQPEVSVIDYTGSSAFGEWIERNTPHARVYTEKAGINSVVIDSIEDLRGVTGNLAFSLCLYSGQMCTTPQNIFIPEDGIATPDGTMSFDDVTAAIVKSVDWFLSDPGRASEVLGAIQSQATSDRIDEIAGSALTVLRASDAPTNERFPDARVRSPLIIELTSADHDMYGQELFGPIVCIIKTPSTKASIEIAADLARTEGAITAAVYSTDPATTQQASDALSAAGAFVSCNLTGQIWMNQAAAFSDFHVSGLNPAGNATLCDAAFIAGRFAFAQSRSIVPEASAVEEDEAHASV